MLMALVDQYLYILWVADIPGSERCNLAFLIDIKRWEWSDTVIIDVVDVWDRQCNIYLGNS